MSPVSAPLRSRTASLLYGLVLVWLIGLSVAAALGYRLLMEQASKEELDAGLRRLHVLEAGVTDLSDAVQTIEAQPEAATEAGLQRVRTTLDERVTQLEQSLAERVGVQELDALRLEINQLKARPTTAQPAPTIHASPQSKPAPVVQPRKVPFPFRVLGVELRAGQRALSIAPDSGPLTAEQIQVLLPGESLGPWRLEPLDGNTAVFRAGQQTRRLAIP